MKRLIAIIAVMALTGITLGTLPSDVIRATQSKMGMAKGTLDLTSTTPSVFSSDAFKLEGLGVGFGHVPLNYLTNPDIGGYTGGFETGATDQALAWLEQTIPIPGSISER